jgi:hypothetical protein
MVVTELLVGLDLALRKNSLCSRACLEVAGMFIRNSLFTIDPVILLWHHLLF